MRATDIRIRLINLNTFGDQYFSNAKNEVMKTYYYSISDLSVGGRYVNCSVEYLLKTVKQGS